MAILALGPSGKLPLDHLKGLRVDDGLVVILHVVLRDLSLIGFHLLGQEVLAEGFLQQGVSLVLLVRQDALDGSLAPLVLACRCRDAFIGQRLGDAVRRHPFEEHMDASSDMNRVGQQEKPAVYTFPTIKPADLPKVAEETIQYGQKKEQPEAMSPAVQEDNNNGVSRTEIEQLVKDFKRSCGDYHVSLKECNPEDTVVGPSVKRFPNASFDHYGIAVGRLSTGNTGTQFFYPLS